MVEVCVAIVCACLPTLRPLFNKSFHSRKLEYSAGTNNVDLARWPSVMLNDRRVGYVNGHENASGDSFKTLRNHWAEAPLRERG